ncbi:MAG: type III pantothenate kinase [bacterium]
MDDLLLAADIGNTHTVLAVYRDEDLIIHWRLSTSITRTEDESWIAAKMLCESGHIPVEKITDVLISSVVPDATLIFKRMVENYLHFSPVLISSDLDLGIRILYDDPRTVGADRLCNAIAGFEKHGGPLIIVDFGTATTFDIVAENGDYMGGVIAPGIETSAADLWKRAAKLHKVELRFPERILGTNPDTSMQSGIMYGSIELVDGLVRRLTDEMDSATPVKVIATGGLASAMIEKTTTIQQNEPNLTLDGMRIIHSRLKRK